MHAPDTQSTSSGSVRPSSAGRLCRDSGLSGKRRVSHELRPAIAVVNPGNRRAEPCTLPSALRIWGATMAASVRVSMYAIVSPMASAPATQSGFSSRKNGDRVVRTPRLTPVAKPSFVDRSISTVHGKRRQISDAASRSDS